MQEIPEQRPTRQDRLFVRDGRRHHRRTYSLGEVRAGAVVVALLALIASWVVWRGAHPDPALHAIEAAPAAAASALASSSPAVSRGPLPADLAPPGWREERVSDFAAENLYVKVNGRADFYRSFGFQHLWVLTLTDAADPGRAIDVEVFDQGSAVNALGTWQGERSPGTAPVIGPGGASHLDRNALFLTRGRHYVRAIGAAEDEGTRAALRAIQARLERDLPGEPLPWSYALFMGGLGLSPGSISYQAENAFSFAFARDVHAALTGEGDTELFAVRTADPAAARTLALQFTNGFRERGLDAGSDGGIAWSEDRDLGTLSGATSRESFVAGVRGAASREEARAALGRLSAALATLPPAAPPVPPVPPQPSRDEEAAPPGYPGDPESRGSAP